MFVHHMDKIMSGVPAKYVPYLSPHHSVYVCVCILCVCVRVCRSLGLDLPKPEEPPPAPWWNKDCDHSLMVGIIKHGMEWVWSNLKATPPNRPTIVSY